MSLETAGSLLQQETGGKVRNDEFLAACGYLREAGSPAGGFAAYVLLGMPGQDPDQAGETICFAHGAGTRVLVAEYSPIPGTRDGERVKAVLPSLDPSGTTTRSFRFSPSPRGNARRH